LKAMYLDGRLSLRTALFHMDRENAQLESWLWDGQNFLWVGFLDNVEASNWGAELELDFELSDRIALFASAGNLESEVDAITTFDLDRGDFVAKNDVEQAKSPGWQFNVGTSVNLPHGWAMRLEVAGRDDSRFGYYHDQTIGAYTLVNASVRRSIGRAELQIWGRNLTDKDYAVHGLYFGNDPRKGWVNETYFQFGEPRVVGVSVRFAL